MIRAVVFDLWQTLAAWPEERSSELRSEWSKSLGVPTETLDELWYGGDLYELRETGPISEAVASLYERLGVEADMGAVLARRLELTRESLVPVDGALPTLQELRRRGLPIGLVSNCTEEVALLWDETPFAELVDAAVFSATAGCMKPDPRIYELVLSRLGVTGPAALFVGDGANHELEGARRVGMTPVLVARDGEASWPGVEGWPGLRVTSLSQVLDLLT